MRLYLERMLHRVRGVRNNSGRDAFISDRRGNIGMIFVLMSGVLFLFVGGAVDYSRWNAVRADMVESMDAASLAVAQLLSDDDSLTADQLEAFGDQFFLENFNYENNLLPGWDINFAVQSSGNVRTCVTGRIKTYLLGVAHINELDMDKCVEITPDGAGRVELAMVLDVTGSMGGQKINDLKSAVDELLTVLYKGDSATTSDNVRIGVVPFNQHVNVGGASSWDDANWGDQNALSFYHGWRFYHVDQNGVVQAGTKVNHYRLYDSDPHRSWEGCVEARPYPLDEMDTVPGVALVSTDITSAMATPSYADEPDSTVRDAFSNAPGFPHGMTATMLASADNSRFVPVFLPNEPDCDHYEECYKAPTTTTFCSGRGRRRHCTTTTVPVEGTTPFGTHWTGDWFSDPDDDPVLTWVRESSYFNNYYIDDRDFTDVSSALNFVAYVDALSQFRNVLNGVTSNADIQAWMNRFRVSDTRQEYIIRSGFPGKWNPSTSQYDLVYDQPKGSSYDGPNPNDCPPPVTPLTDDRTVINAAKLALTANGGTNVANGAMWGWRLVSPEAPFTESIGPGDTGPNNTTDGDWQRAVLIMTDGNNDFADLNTHWGSYPSAYGYESEERMGDGVNEADSSSLSNDMEDETDRKLLRICRRMKQKNILVYTIVFDVSSGSTIEGIMQSCASSPSAPFFYNAASGADLEEAFGLIAADLVKLHVSQ